MNSFYSLTKQRVKLPFLMGFRLMWVMGEIKTPHLSVDIIIENKKGEVVLIERKNPPFGWALPGGFVDIGESVEGAAIREAKEETGLDIKLITQFHVYSDPKRDNRFHSVSVVFLSRAEGKPKGMDDAKQAQWFSKNSLPSPLVFDHSQIITDYTEGKYL